MDLLHPKSPEISFIFSSWDELFCIPRPIMCIITFIDRAGTFSLLEKNFFLFSVRYNREKASSFNPIPTRKKNIFV